MQQMLQVLRGRRRKKCNYLDKGEVTGGGICTPVDKGEVAGGGICAPAGLLAGYREREGGID